MSMVPGKLFYKTLLYLLDTAVIFLPVKGRDRDSRDRERVLVARPDGIGDFVLSTPSLGGIRKFYPPESHEITLIANASLSEIASATPLMDEVILVDRQLLMRNLAYRWKFMRKIRLARYDVALNPVFSRVAMIDDSIIRVTRAPRRIAWQGNLDNISKAVRKFTDRWYTQLIPCGDERPMELVRNAQFVRSLGFNEFRTALPFVAVCAKWKMSAEELFRGEDILPEPYYVVLPGTGLPPERAWPPDRYGELSRLVVQSGMGSVVVCGSKDDRELGKKVLAISGSDQVFDLTGKTELGVLAALLKGAEAVVGSDTGGVHLAAAVGGRAVSILGGAFPGRFFPYETEKTQDNVSEDPAAGHRSPVVVKSPNPCRCPNWLCTRQDWKGNAFPCLAEVGVDEVFLALRMMRDDLSERVSRQP